LRDAFVNYRLVAVGRHRRHSFEVPAASALHGSPDMAVDVTQREWSIRHDVGAMNETEGRVAEPRRIIAEESLAPFRGLPKV
jgi:hypothetical protein